MSKTFTSRPGLTNSRGRGTQQRQVHAVNSDRLGEMNPETGSGPYKYNGARHRATNTQRAPVAGRGRVPDRGETDAQEEPQQEHEPDLERRMTYQGGYSMIAPNQKKRQEISQVAQRETQAYQEHKQQNTQKSYNYVGTAGGGQLTQTESRKKMIQESPTKTQKLLKNQERKSYFKQKEDEEAHKKKEEQRKKAVQNEQNRKETEIVAEHRWDKQKKRTNEAFLRRFENKKPTGAHGSTNTPAIQSTSPSRSSERLQPVGAYGTAPPPVDIETNQHSASEDDLSSVEYARVNQLAGIFPQYSETELWEILKQVGFSLDAAVGILQD